MRSFRVNGKVEATTAPVDMRLQRLLALVPGLLHGEVRTALVIGLGSGMTAGSLLDLPTLEETLDRFQLHGSIQPFGRCTRCNDELDPVDKQAVEHRLQPKTRRYYHEFWMCRGCGRVYWKGSHFQHMRRLVAQITPNRRDSDGPASDNRS